jgi:hypothetical protein
MITEIKLYVTGNIDGAYLFFHYAVWSNIVGDCSNGANV